MLDAIRRFLAALIGPDCPCRGSGRLHYPTDDGAHPSDPGYCTCPAGEALRRREA